MVKLGQLVKVTKRLQVTKWLHSALRVTINACPAMQGVNEVAAWLM